MALIIASTDWSWALPLVGPAAALFGAMAAIACETSVWPLAMSVLRTILV